MLQSDIQKGNIKNKKWNLKNYKTK
jgi:hypothetical protein